MKILAYLVVLIGVLLTSQWQNVLSSDTDSAKLLFRTVESQTTPGDTVEGNRVTFYCDIVPPNAFIYIRNYFYHNGTAIYTKPEIGVYNFGKYLTIERINKTDEGFYNCIAYVEKRPDLKSLYNNSILQVGNVSYFSTIRESPDAALLSHSNNYMLRVGDKPKVSPGAPDIKEISNVSLRLISRTFTPENIEQFSDVSLECDVQPSAIIYRKYTWFRNNIEILSDNMIGAKLNFSTLVFRRIEPTAGGIYLCKVETEKSVSWSNFLPITVLEKINAEEVRKWLKELDDSEKFKASLDALEAYSRLGAGINPDDIREFDNVYFVCEISSNITEITKITWFENGRLIEPNPELGIIQRDPLLILERVPKDVAGFYHCEIKTKYKRFYSTYTLLRIKSNSNSSTIDWNKVKPEAFMQLGDGLNEDNIVEQDDVHFTCTFLPPNSTRIRKISWLHNRLRIERSERVGLLNQNSTLVLPRIEKYYAGEYQCLIYTDLGMFHSSSVVITVHDISARDPPTLVARIENKALSARYEEFQDAFIQCEITPDLSNVRIVKWLHNDKILSPLEDGVDILTWTSILIIPRIKLKYAGIYKCQITTKAGALIHSNPVEIMVSKASKFFPSFVKDPLVIAELVDHPETISVNKPTFFHCHVHTIDTEIVYRVFWSYNDATLDPNARFSWYRYSNRTLVVLKTRPEHVGNYMCSVETSIGFYMGIPAELTKVLAPRELEVISQNRTVGTKLVVELQDDPDNIYDLDNVVFYCNVQPNKTKFQTISWYCNHSKIVERKPFNGRSMRYGERVYIIPHAVGSAHNGNYFCEILTYEGTAFRSGPTRLNIKKRLPGASYPPPVSVKVFAQLGDPSEIDNIHLHDNIYFTCNVTSNYNITVLDVLWYLDHNPIYSSANGSIMYVNQDLYIYNIAKEATGTYSCDVGTKRGQYPSESNVILKVKGPRF